MKRSGLLKKILWTAIFLTALLAASMVMGILMGSTGVGIKRAILSLASPRESAPMLHTIIWQIRFPRVLLAALVGAALSLGGLVFQALLRNPLAEPYILGISSGSGIGAILGILAGLSRFPGVSLTAFAGSIATLLLLFVMSSGKTILKSNSLLLSGVMVNSFCAALIMFLISITQDARLHNIIFWLMGDLSMINLSQVGILAAMLAPCFLVLFCFSNQMNLLLIGKEMAQSMGVNIRIVVPVLLLITSLMVSATVSFCGPIGFVGLVMPHLLRLISDPITGSWRLHAYWEEEPTWSSATFWRERFPIRVKCLPASLQP